MRLADAFPERVRSLTLIEPVLFAVAARDAPEMLEAHNRDAAPFAEALAAGDNALAARLFNRMWSDGGPRWRQLPGSTRAAMTRGLHVVRACDGPVMRDSPGLLDAGRLDRLDMPVLLLRGARTHPIIAVVNDGLARRIPGAESRVIDGAGHMLPISQPAATAQAVADLFERAGA
jgi:pimeloyl-ACP methyl ester carboxylesterase